MKKKDCWIKNCKGQVISFVYYTKNLKQKGRIVIEQEIREIFQPDCKMDRK